MILVSPYKSSFFQYLSRVFLVLFQFLAIAGWCHFHIWVSYWYFPSLCYHFQRFHDVISCIKTLKLGKGGKGDNRGWWKIINLAEVSLSEYWWWIRKPMFMGSQQSDHLRGLNWIRTCIKMYLLEENLVFLISVVFLYFRIETQEGFLSRFLLCQILVASSFFSFASLLIFSS